MKQEKLTRFIKSDDVEKKWYIVDASNKVLGRLASQIAKIIRGKNKPTFTPNMDTGDYVIVINADKVVLTGKRPELKQYIRHSGYPGGQKITSVKTIRKTKPEFLVEHAVKGMLPKNMEDVAFKLCPGEISDIIENDIGYHILQVSEKKIAEKIKYALVKDDLENLIMQKNFADEVEKYVDLLKKNAKIEIYDSKLK